MRNALLFIFCLTSFYTFSQPCLPQGITFNTQAQIDSFYINYPNCTEIGGNVVIQGGTSIINLYGLTGLKYIGGQLEIFSSNSLSNLSGLDSLTSVNALSIYNNASLSSLSGLQHLDSVGEWFSISGNPQLTSFIGLEQLSVINGNCYLSGMVSGMAGLNNLTTVNGFLQIGPLPNLVTLAGLERLRSIGSIFTLTGCSLLTDMTGLDSLTTIMVNLTIMQNGLTSLHGIESVTTVGWYIGIQYNPMLTDITGIANINAGSVGGGIVISSNPNLSSCAVQSVCDYISIPGGNVYIYDNAPGCDNSQEVIDACAIIAAHDAEKQTGLSLYRSIGSPGLTIEIPLWLIGCKFQILDLAGRTVLEGRLQQSPCSISTSNLKGGLYLIRIDAPGGEVLAKVVIL